MNDFVKRMMASLTFFVVLVIGVSAEINIWIVLIAAFLVSGLIMRIP